MTICVCVQVYDSIVFAADSATTLSSVRDDGQAQIQNVYMNANKVFNLVRDWPIAGMTAGLGNIGSQSISVLSKDLRFRLTGDDPEYALVKSSYTIEECAQKARRFLFEEKYQSLGEELRPKGEHQLDYWVGGFSAGSDLPELWKFSILNGDCPDPIQILGQGVTSIAWGGQPEAISRLVLGYGTGLMPALTEIGLKDDQQGGLLNHLANRLATPLVAAAMPTQDAVDLADFLVDVAKGYVRFLEGANTVGGDTDVAAITKHEGFKWVRRKHYIPARLNPGSANHNLG